ncbi:MAG: putative NADH:flavin oxidoreductase/NADH oxidase [Myxococcales bacterium]
MTDQVAHLARPLTLPNGAVLPNRVAKSAMSERLAGAGGVPGEELRTLYRRWGQSGAGLLITGNVMVDRQAIAEHRNAVIEADSDLTALRDWAAACGPTPTWVQINHPGRQAPRTVSSRPVAPSVVPMRGLWGAFARPRALEETEIHRIVERFAESAALVQAAGFDGVQIHAAHGYLVSQFLSPLTNLRTDGWGGSPERRRRFLLEIVRAIRSAVGPRFSLGVKLNSADFQRGGFDETESMAVVEALNAEGIDLLEISGGTYEAAAMFAESRSESTRRREAFFLDYANAVRSRVKVPLMVTGGFRSAEAMESAVAGGIDLVGLARPFAAVPDLPAQLLGGSLASAPTIRLNSGLKMLDSLVQGAWYQLQIHRMGNGLDPDLRVGRLRAAVSYFTRGAARPAISPRPALAPPGQG